MSFSGRGLLKHLVKRRQRMFHKSIDQNGVGIKYHWLSLLNSAGGLRALAHSIEMDLSNGVTMFDRLSNGWIE